MTGQEPASHALRDAQGSAAPALDGDRTIEATPPDDDRAQGLPSSALRRRRAAEALAGRIALIVAGLGLAGTALAAAGSGSPSGSG